MTQIKAVSVIIPVNERGEDLPELLAKYHANLLQTNLKIEYILILTPQYRHLAESIEKLNSDSCDINIIILNRNYGEAGEIKIGVDHAQHEHILTLPAYEQIAPELIPQVFDALEDKDVLVVNRWPRIDPITNKIQSFLFKWFFKAISFEVPKDAGCGIRLIKKEVFDDIKFYGDFHRFILVLVQQAGFSTRELDIPQSKVDAFVRTYSLRTYFTRVLDIITAGFLTRFIKKPLRFFGSIGVNSAIIGLLGLIYLVVDRLVFDIPIGERPLMILFTLFLVLGVQLVAIGLVGETIIFTNAKENKEYRIRKIIN